MNHNKCETLHHPATVPINEGGTSIVVCSRCFINLTPTNPTMIPAYPILSNRKYNRFHSKLLELAAQAQRDRPLRRKPHTHTKEVQLPQWGCA